MARIPAPPVPATVPASFKAGRTRISVCCGYPVSGAFACTACGQLAPTVSIRTAQRYGYAG